METGPVFLWNKHPELYSNVDSSSKVIIVNQGGTSCFSADTEIMTNEGVKKIQDVKVGDIVESFNESSGLIEKNKVLNLFKYSNQKNTVKIRLKNGTEIICTDDHKFYVKGEWISIKNVLYMYEHIKNK